MSVFPLNDEDREKAAHVICAAEDCGHHEGDGPYCSGCEAYATHALAALEASGWTLLPPGTATVERERRVAVVTRPPYYEVRWRVVGPWTPKETET